MTSNSALLHHTPSPDDKSATLIVDVRARAPYTISPLLYGKFCEHLGANIYLMVWKPRSCPTAPSASGALASATITGMEASVRRQTAAGWNSAFRLTPLAWAGQMLGRSSMPTSWGGIWLVRGRAGEGARAGVRLSPDVGPYGDRAQRVEVLSASENTPRGIGQWTYLPLHRTRRYHFRMVARAVTPARSTSP